MHEYRAMVAGPTNLAALLNSLRIGFSTLAIQHRTSELCGCRLIRPSSIESKCSKDHCRLRGGVAECDRRDCFGGGHLNNEGAALARVVAHFYVSALRPDRSPG